MNTIDDFFLKFFQIIKMDILKCTCGIIAAYYLSCKMYDRHLQRVKIWEEKSGDNLIEDFKELSLSLNNTEKSFIRDAKIYSILYPCPGKGYRRWKQTKSATFYRKNNKIKTYHHLRE
jgi:hypothetical protein